MPALSMFFGIIVRMQREKGERHNCPHIHAIYGDRSIALREVDDMLRPTAVAVCVACDYKILVQFDNGEKREFDVEPYIVGEWYGKLRAMEYFRRVSTDGFTVVWPDGQDICPDELYYNSKLVS